MGHPYRMPEDREAYRQTHDISTRLISVFVGLGQETAKIAVFGIKTEHFSQHRPECYPKTTGWMNTHLRKFRQLSVSEPTAPRRPGIDQDLGFASGQYSILS